MQTWFSLVNNNLSKLCSYLTQFIPVIHIAWVDTSCLCAMCYPQSISGGGGGAVGISEKSEQNFVTKYIHAPYLAWGLYYMYLSYPKPSPKVGAVGCLQ